MPRWSECTSLAAVAAHAVVQFGGKLNFAHAGLYKRQHLSETVSEYGWLF